MSSTRISQGSEQRVREAPPARNGAVKGRGQDHCSCAGETQRRADGGRGDTGRHDATRQARPRCPWTLHGSDQACRWADTKCRARQEPAKNRQDPAKTRRGSRRADDLQMCRLCWRGSTILGTAAAARPHQSATTRAGWQPTADRQHRPSCGRRRLAAQAMGAPGLRWSGAAGRARSARSRWPPLCR